jgi:hypothetical protein
VLPSYKPGVKLTNLHDALPRYAIDAMQEALPVFGRKIRGYDMPDAVLTGVETRTSAPLRITRGDDFQSLNVRGLYPAGEGAGYAGGILSAGVDGIKVAEAVARSIGAAMNKAARRRPQRLTPAILQRGDALFDRRVGAEQLADATGNAHGRHALGQFTGHHAAQAGQRVDHGLLAAHQLRGAGVGAELALAAEPGHDDGGQQAQHDVQHDGRDM